MEKVEALETFLEDLKKRMPTIDKYMDEVTKAFAPALIDYLRKQTSREFKTFSRALNFRLRLVIDNNILFAEINGLIKGNKDVENCFFYQLALNKSVDFYAPPFLQDEIFEKVEQKFADEDKPKAKKYAQKLLSVITIKEASWVEDWIKAKRKIGHRDSDDIPYLALCFDLNSHGIMSNDKIFVEEQSDAKVWKIKDAGKITAQYNKGVVSFFFVGNIPNLFKVIGDLLSATIAPIINFIKDMIKIIIGVIKEGLTWLMKLPSELWILFGGLFLTAYLVSDDFNNSVNGMFLNTKEYMLKLLRRLRIWFEKFLDFIKSICEILKPHAITTATYLLYLITNGITVIEQIKAIEGE